MLKRAILVYAMAGVFCAAIPLQSTPRGCVLTQRMPRRSEGEVSWRSASTPRIQALLYEPVEGL